MTEGVFRFLESMSPDVDREQFPRLSIIEGAPAAIAEQDERYASSVDAGNSVVHQSLTEVISLPSQAPNVQLDELNTMSQVSSIDPLMSPNSQAERVAKGEQYLEAIYQEMENKAA